MRNDLKSRRPRVGEQHPNEGYLGDDLDLMRVSFNIEKVKTISEHQPDRDEEDRRGNDRCSCGNPGPQAIVVVQTVLGLLGFWVAGTQVRSIIKGSAKLRAIGAIWSMLLHGEIRGQGDVSNDPNEARPPPREDA